MGFRGNSSVELVAAKQVVVTSIPETSTEDVAITGLVRAGAKYVVAGAKEAYRVMRPLVDNVLHDASTWLLAERKAYDQKVQLQLTAKKIKQAKLNALG